MPSPRPILLLRPTRSASRRCVDPRARTLIPRRARSTSSAGTFAPRPIHAGRTTPHPPPAAAFAPAHPFYFDTGYALFAKRPPRPFPPPFTAPHPRRDPAAAAAGAATDEADPTHDHLAYDGAPLRAATAGDDALLAEPHLLAAADGVGAWASRPHGHAAAWSRALLHAWAEALGAEARAGAWKDDERGCCEAVEALHEAYETTRAAATGRPPHVWHGTTTAVGALLAAGPAPEDGGPAAPRLYATNLGDSKVLVIRPAAAAIVFRTAEQWHWFDCPRQLGTNSPDSPREHATCECVSLAPGDVVVAATDGLVDNLWEHEVLASVLRSLARLEESGEGGGHGGVGQENEMMWVAEELVREARTVAEDPFAESPFMERAVEEGVGFEGGKCAIGLMCGFRV